MTLLSSRRAGQHAIIFADPGVIGDPLSGDDTPSDLSRGPLEALSELHAHTLRQCATLRQLVLHVAGCGCDAQARQAAENALGYFDVWAPRYFKDEEEDLFPALLESMAGSDAVCLQDLTSGMAQQHRSLETMWARLREQLAGIASGHGSILDSAEVEAFVTLNQGHIEREQTELLPMAARLLTDDALAQVWTSMRKRHGAA
jgi:hemerythrin-like domain-containing protein